MLIEVKVQVTRIIDTKKRKKLETYILNKDFFSEAEYKVTEILNTQHDKGIADNFEIQSLKLSTIKEMAYQYEGQYKSQAIYTAFNDDWIHFIKLRADNVSGKVHPNMKIIADKIKELFNNK